MKFVSLIFDYNLTKMINSGRLWSVEAYKNKDYIFEYSAASIATILDKNHDIKYEVWTDDVNLLSEKLSFYNVQTKNLDILEKTKEISEWTKHTFCFWPLIKFYENFALNNEHIIKLDNDLTCLKNCDELSSWEHAVVWKFERKCNNGRDYWGEKYCASKAFGTDKFDIYNTGIFSIGKNNLSSVSEIAQLCEKMINVDASHIIRFPENTKAKAKYWSCSDQTSNCYFIHTKNIPIKQTNDFFEHHCYVKTKQECIERAKYLLK
jgi:hypothetical protein